jgi:PAT family acetyl-CoA transporter-like MFS transporter 1
MGERKYNPSRVLGGDLMNLLMLGFLYCLQGIPLGLCIGSLPILLKKHMTYTQIGFFTLASYPFSLKFLWSPLVDSYYIPDWGRRKSWVVPLQLLSGGMMIYLSSFIDDMIKDENSISSLTFYFFVIVCIYATQDIAVDGWAIELLLPENQSYASTSQTIGQLIGFFCSFTVFLSLNSPEFCNMLIFDEPQHVGILEAGQYVYFWGMMNILACVLVGLLKKEDPACVSTVDLGFGPIYKRIYQYLKLPTVKGLIFILLTSKFVGAAHDNALGLVILEKGFPEAELGVLAVFQLPIDILLSLMIGYLCRHYNELNLYFIGYMLKLGLSIYGMWVLYLYPDDNHLTFTFYALMLIGTILNSVASNFMFVTMCAFFNKIAEKAIGGTFLTLMTTLFNFGGTWPKLIILYLLDKFTIPSYCKGTSEYCSYECETGCTEGETGYYTVSWICITFGCIYAIYLEFLIKKLTKYSKSAWGIESIEKSFD